MSVQTRRAAGALPIIGIMLLFLGLSTQHAGAQQESGPAAVPDGRAMIVLDASGSMWGQIDGVNKIVIARGVIGDLLSDWDDGVHLGLTAYGHRSKGDCNDIETLVPVGPDNAGRITEVVDNLNPKGKTPISEAIRQAAEGLKHTEEAATVILVTDGLETCEADPCAVAQALEQSGVDFTAHVIGFDVSEAEGKTLQCIADQTGGQYFSAGNAGELKDALDTVAKTLPTEDPARLSIVLAPGQEPLKDVDARFQFFTADAVEAPDASYVSVNFGDTGVARLTAGDYVAQIKLGAVERSHAFNLTADGKRSFTANLNAAMIDVSASLSGDALDRQHDLKWEIKALDSGGKTTGSGLGYAYGLGTRFFVPPGDYRITAQLGGARASADFNVKAGDKIAKEIDLRAGTLAFDAVLMRGGAAVDGDFKWEVYAVAPDGKSRGDNRGYMYGGSGRFVVTNGPHILKVTAGSIVRETRIDVAPDTTTQTTVLLDGGYISFHAVMTPGGETIKNSNFAWEASPVAPGGAASRQKVAYNYGGSGRYLLPSGDYILRFKGHAVRHEERIRITPGADLTKEIVLNAGFVDFVLTDETGDRLSRSVLWHIHPTGSDDDLTYGLGTGGVQLVPAGAHEIRVNSDGRIGKAGFDIRPGRTTEIKVQTRAQ